MVRSSLPNLAFWIPIVVAGLIKSASGQQTAGAPVFVGCFDSTYRLPDAFDFSSAPPGYRANDSEACANLCYQNNYVYSYYKEEGRACLCSDTGPVVEDFHSHAVPGLTTGSPDQDGCKTNEYQVKIARSTYKFEGCYTLHVQSNGDFKSYPAKDLESCFRSCTAESKSVVYGLEQTKPECGCTMKYDFVQKDFKIPCGAHSAYAYGHTPGQYVNQASNLIRKRDPERLETEREKEKMMDLESFEWLNPKYDIDL